MIASQLTYPQRERLLQLIEAQARLHKSCAEDPRARPAERTMSTACVSELGELARIIKMSDVIEFARPPKVVDLPKKAFSYVDR